MVRKYKPSVTVDVDNETGVAQADGNVEVVLNVPVSVTGYSGEGVSDEDIEQAVVEAIQEGEGRIVEFRPTIRQRDE